jgi:5-methylcytosine-specific restriction endonuclease McrA
VPDLAIKRCCRCGNEHPATAEFFGKSKRDGMFAQCKQCRRGAYHGAAMEKRKEKYASDPKFRELALSSSNAAYHKNRDEYLEKQRRYSSKPENIEKARQRSRQWQIENPDRVRVNIENRRARLANAPGFYSEQDVIEMLNRQGRKCHYCGCDVSSGKHTVDHSIPISRGGSNWPENLVVSCARCNAIKGVKTPPEFYEYLIKRSQKWQSA